MDGRWIKRLPPVCAAGGGLLLTGTAAACARLTLGGAGDRLFVAVSLLAVAGLGVGLVWLENRRPARGAMKVKTPVVGFFYGGGGEDYPPPF